jgi:carbamoyl-phosphate synthase large subunit
LPKDGAVFFSLRDEDQEAAVPLAKRLVALGFTLFSTRGTSTVMRGHGIHTQAIFRIHEGRPNALDIIEEHGVAWVVNTPSTGAAASQDEMKIRSTCIMRGIPITTTLHGLSKAIEGLESLAVDGATDVCSLQEYHRHSPRIDV